jgi:predicted nuclease with TOPRIM domain
MSAAMPDTSGLHRKLQARLAALQGEFERGQERLAQLAQEEESLRATLLRISGAIQVLQEELGEADAGSAP